jgi:hypothetical protein
MTTINVVKAVLIEDARLTCRVKHVYGSHWESNLIPSRTLAFHFLWESTWLFHWNHYPPVESGALTRQQAEDLMRSAPLSQALEGRNLTDESWNRVNTGRFISCVGVVDRQHCDKMWSDLNDPRWDEDPTLWDTKPRPAATFNIAVTDPRWLSHIVPEMEWDSVGYDHDSEIPFDTVWRTSDVMSLARGIDSSQDFSGMLILADALQEAGCNSDELLNHLRDPQATHVRGCWALDLVLGKK